MDGVIIANECPHSRNREKVSGIMCKLDLEKAYDRVDWGFLSYLMHHTGFGDKRCHWVMESVSSTKLSILINGSPKGFFSTQRGLHQGNPSPCFYLP